MEDKDIVGREFSVFNFGHFKSIDWTSDWDKHIGCKGVVKKLHRKWPEYAYVAAYNNKGETVGARHFPTHMIVEQLEKEDDITIDEILNSMKQLILEI